MEDGKLMRKLLAPHWWDMTPLEAKTFITLYWFADPASHDLSVSLFNLAQKVNCKTRKMIPCIEKLRLRGLLEFTPGKNPLLASRFKILSGKKEKPGENLGENGSEIEHLPVDAEDFQPPVNDTVNVKRSERFFKNNVTTVNVNGTKASDRAWEEEIETSDNLTAQKLANAFNDQDNLALYETYLKRYSYAVIYKAYLGVLNTPPEKIKRSAGAYFTFLVKKLGG